LIPLPEIGPRDGA